ncbi:MAG: PadR family transcriptional regulator [Acidimicrobiales bacterium]
MVQLMQDDAAIRRFEDELSSPRKILRACLLLLLEERAGHGYDLLTRLEPLGFERSNPGRVYRALRWLETAGFVQPNWETTGVGPARRVYELSPSGRHALEISAATLRRQAKSVDDRLARYILGRLRVLSNNKQVFEFTVEAQLSVQAIDATSARRKLERAFGQPHVLDTDVRTTGGVSIRSTEADHEPEAPPGARGAMPG